MSEVKVVDLSSLSKRGNYQVFIDAALTMPRGSAVHVDVAGLKSLNSNVNQAISARNLREKLAVKCVQGQIYIIHRSDK